MNEEQLIKRISEKMLEIVKPEMADLSARLSAQRLLIEDLFATLWIENVEGLSEHLDQLRALSSAVTPAHPMNQGDLEELTVRQRVHMDRITQSIAERTQSRASKNWRGAANRSE
jgi:hypothetical protein